MGDFKCPMCGKGMMEEQFIPVLKKRFEGVKIRVRNAHIHQCNACGEMSYSARELKRWKEIKIKTQLTNRVNFRISVSMAGFVFGYYAITDGLVYAIAPAIFSGVTFFVTMNVMSFIAEKFKKPT